MNWVTPRRANRYARWVSHAITLVTFVRYIIDILPEECADIVGYLGASKESALDLVHDKAAVADSAQDWQHKARLAVVALHLGDASLGRDMCEPRPDPMHRRSTVRFCSEV